ncbi:tryptophan synthase subunit alpha [Kordiimonas sp. SCSIO 12610]|uniref:tryptophan synthase subunit alpha n=1 Tax=Kordiimonas sp. SCSIO 12610 TaxID=2829597 RepID=UPI00210EC533|nr:tryptophan synthase subunit alpha [Kordiimonas sp. SCSIO 12610]UTW55218.1 tryptophan synthase subunit alpha [Kordiimonas sp. SCSIO 12610]
MSRLEAKFTELRAANKAGFVAFITAGDPNYDTSLNVLKGLPSKGVDIIELGMPFTDPSADGPAIDRAAQRALKGGMSLAKTLDMVRSFREDDQDTPIVLMGYFNPVFAYGIEKFASDAARAGVDGLIIVDLPPEEDEELRLPANAAGINVIRLATPTSDDVRLPKVLEGASGFVYYVAVAGVTGGKSATEGDIQNAITHIRKHTDLPVAVGFGIKTPEQAAIMAKYADGVVVGSAIVSMIEDGIDPDGSTKTDLVDDVLDFVKTLSDGAHSGRNG